MNGFQRVIKAFAICFAVAIIVNICVVTVSVLSLLANIDNNNDTSGVIMKNDFVETYQEVEQVYIDASISTVTIKQGNEFKVEASNMENNFSAKLENGVLKIQESKKWIFNNDFAGTINVYIPQNAMLEKLDIDFGVGQVEIYDVNAEFLNINQGAGILEISNSKFDKTNIEGGTGRVDITNSTLNDLDFDAGVGSINMQAIITGNNNISVGVGSMNIVICGNKEDYSIKVDKGIGSVNIDGADYSSDAMYGNGQNTVKVDGGIGSINISFQNI